VLDLSANHEVDLILVTGKQHDGVSELLEEADLRGMGVYVGMPTASSHPDYPWEVLEAKPIFFELLNRVLASYRCRHYSQRSFAGVYQSFETHVSDPPIESALALYEKQHALVRTMLPRKKIAISPYWDARK
jgi:hypothetical protein